MRRLLPVLAVAALVAVTPAAAFTPADPLAPKQWYLADDHAFDVWATPPTDLATVKVAVVDSGIDSTLPDFAGRIAAAQSFVGGSPFTDTEGHGTFVAGVIAANLDTQGIAGMAYSAQLLIAKVVTADGRIPLNAEADAIRWAVDNGARVINLSLGGVRDPLHRDRDTYSALEANAIAYAYAHGAVLVAAVGNADEAYSQPWPYASYPAALPHVIGVSALTRNGNVADFSDRDAVYNDIAAPGVGIFSTFPSALTQLRPACTDQGFSDCGPDDYSNAEGTSFSAPQVSAAAATLLALDPALTNSQVAAILEHTADDVNASTGCGKCAVGRDAYTGWGRLDVARAVGVVTAGPLPSTDAFETNDDAGAQAHTLWGKNVVVNASLDYYDDPVDVYKVALSGRERLTAKLAGALGNARVSLVLWKPDTTSVGNLQAVQQRAAQSAARGAVQRLTFTAPGRGWYYLEAKVMSPGFGSYSLVVTKTTP